MAGWMAWTLCTSSYSYLWGPGPQSMGGKEVSTARQSATVKGRA
jgi:hypothetical protein